MLTDFQKQYGGGGAFQFMDKSGFDASGNAVSRYTAPTPTMTPSTPMATTPTTPTSRYTTPANKPALQTVDENAIRETTRKNMQAQIDAINAQYANLIQQEQVAGEDRSGQARAVNARSGLVGSDFGTAQANKTQQFNQQQIKTLEDQKASAVNAVLLNIEDRATAEIERKKAEALGQYERDFTEFEREQESARNDLKALAGSGFDLNTLQPEQKTALLRQAGYDENMGELIYNAMKPKASQIDFKFEKLADGQGLFYGIDPTTGQLVTKNVSVDLPADWQMQIAPDGTLIGYDKNTGQAKILSGQGQFAKPETNLPGSDLLPTEKDRSAFNQIVNKYNTSPLIAAADRTIILQNTVNAVKANPQDRSLQPNLAYGYIQALDSYQSAVREGELANVETIDSKIGKLENWVQRITHGQKVRPEIAKQIANAAQLLVDYINEGAQRKEKVFESQARVNGISDAWNEFRSGFTTNYDAPPPGEAQDTTEQLKFLMEQGYSFDEASEAVADELGGFNSVGSDTKIAPTGMRTDRHNNPTAFTTDIAKMAGLKLGVDYEIGDQFPNNPNLKTAKLLKDPVATTIKVIDNIGFYTQSGKPRWSYVSKIPEASKWKSLSPDQKKSVIKKMYAFEGGKQLLNHFA